MADHLVENALVATDYIADKYWDQGYNAYRRWVNGKLTQSSYTPHRSRQKTSRSSSNPHSSSNSNSQPQPQPQPKTRPRSQTLTDPPVVPVTTTANSQEPLARSSTRGRRSGRRSTNSVRDKSNPPPAFPRVCDLDEDRRSETSDTVIQEYEREKDDPCVKPEAVLSHKELRRDSAMSYNDNYQQTQYGGQSSRPRSQPPKSSRYNEDEDSDYDERSGRRYQSGGGRGYDDRDYDDRDYDRVIEETERYRGPPFDRNARRESSRSQNNDDAYGAGGGTVARYSRRSTQDLETYGGGGSRRSKSRGRDRDRSDSRSRSRSREMDVKRKIEESFDTSTRGLGVGLAGAVIGGLAGRQFGHKHQNRDIIIGALVGGLGANAAETKWRDWKDEKESKIKRDEQRFEQKWDGRSRSNVR